MTLNGLMEKATLVSCSGFAKAMIEKYVMMPNY